MADEYSSVFEAYKGLPPDIKKKYDAFRAKNYPEGLYVPAKQMERDLEAIIAKHSASTEIHASTPSGKAATDFGGLLPTLTPKQSGAYLLTVLAAIISLA
ncbi:MAG: hypothetical protein Q8R04_03290 [Nanoarchaeota archaeon]|nr:hypothetical protein [Nanoarchaeota archaeon]